MKINSFTVIIVILLMCGNPFLSLKAFSQEKETLTPEKPVFAEAVNDDLKNEKISNKPVIEQTEKNSLGEIIVTATRTKTLSERLPVTAHTVTRKDMDSQVEYGRNNYGELIRNVPGVHVAQAPMTAPPWVNIRGTGYFVGRTLYLVDGLPVTSSTTPMLTTTINNNDIEQIDVLLGTSSAIYGANAAGGVINIITREGKDGMGAGWSMGYGSNDTIRPNVSVGDRIDGFHYYVSYSGDYSEGYRMVPVKGMTELYNAGKKSYLSSASLHPNKYENTYFSAKTGWNHDDNNGFYIAYNYAYMYAGGGQKNLISLDDGKQGIGSIKGYGTIGSFVKITGTFGQQFWDRPSKSNKGLSLDADGNLLYDRTKVNANESRLSRYIGELQADCYLNKFNALTAGGFFSTEDLESEQKDWNTGVRKSKTETKTDQMAGFIQHQVSLIENRLNILAGVRYDRWRFRDIYDTASIPAKPAGFSQDTFTYRGGAKFKINRFFSVRGSGGTGFWPGSATWFFQNTNTGTTWREANRDLKPEKSWMLDSGIEATFTSIGQAYNITPYYGKLNNMIMYRYDQHPTIATTTIIRTRNASEAEIYGVEILFTQVVAEYVSFFISHTQNHARIVKDETPSTGKNINVKDNQVSNSPDYFGSTGIKYDNPAVIGAQATLRYSGQRYYDNENTNLQYYKMKPYRTVDLKLWREWVLCNVVRYQVSVSVNNVFDSDYESEFTYVNPGRTWNVTCGMRYIF